MEKIKKHAAIPALAVALAIMIMLAVYTYRLKDNGEFEIKDLIGSRAAIQDVVISGELRDGYHRTSFGIAEGQVSTDTVMFRQPQFGDFYFNNAKRTWDGMEYSIENYPSSYKITSRKRMEDYYSIPVGNSEVNPPIYYRDPEGRENTVTLANPPEYGLTKIGDTVYYTVPVSPFFTGSSGIYELKFYEWGFGPIVDRDAYAPRKIVDIDLTAKKPDGQSGIEVLGLESVGDQLVLLSVENNALLITSYDSGSGQWLGEASVRDFHLPARQGDNQPSDVIAYYENYEAYSDHDRHMLTLSFRRSSSEPDRKEATIISLDFSDGVKVADTVNAVFDDGEEDTYSGNSYMSYRNGKLYVIKAFREPETEVSRVSYDILRSRHMYIYVYDQSELIYKGELVTDRNEDNIQAYNLPPAQSGFGYNQMEYRYFANVVIE